MSDKKSNRGGAREGAGNFQRWPTIRGVKVFAAQTGYTLSFIKAVQATPAGAEAFKENIIDSLKFIRAANALLGTANELPEGFATWKEFREMNDARIAEVKRKEAQKLVMLTSDGKRQAADAMALTFGELDRRDRDLPPSLASRNAVEISERMLADTKGIKKTLAEKFQEIGK